MRVTRGEHTELEARAKAEPAADVMTRDYYTQLPQIRLTGEASPAEITLDGNDVGAFRCKPAYEPAADQASRSRDEDRAARHAAAGPG